MSPIVLIFDEPTRGIDVGAKNEIYRLMRDLSDRGVGILMISSDMEEVIGVSDRVAVMHEGRITGLLERGDLSEQTHSVACGRKEFQLTIPSTIYLRQSNLMINEKTFGYSFLILVVGAIVAIINPRFLSPLNLSNTANLIGLFGIFAVAQAFVIISGRDRTIGRIRHCSAWRDLHQFHSHRSVGSPHWPSSSCCCLDALIGFVHGYLVAKVGLQPFVVTLCGLLIYRGVARYYTDDATAGFPFGASFPTLEWLTSGRFYGIPHSLIAFAAHRRHDGDCPSPFGLRPLSLRGRQE